MKRELIVRELSGGHRWVEERSGLLFGVYRWRNAPFVFVSIGRNSKVDTILEVGLFGRILWIAPRP